MKNEKRATAKAMTPQPKGKDSDFQRYSKIAMCEYANFSTQSYKGKTSLQKLAERIKSGEFKGVPKAKLPPITYHNDNPDYNAPSYNLQIATDFDKKNLPNFKAEEVKAKLMAMTYPPIMLHTTVSGGVRAVFAINGELAHTTAEEHRRIGNALNSYLVYNKVEGLDAKCTPDIKRRYYPAHDFDAILNEDFKPLDIEFVEKWSNVSPSNEKPLKSQVCSDDDVDYFAHFVEMEQIRENIKTPFVEGDMNNHVTSFFHSCGYANIPKEHAIQYLNEVYVPMGMEYDDAMTTCAKRYDKGVADRAKDDKAKADRLNPDRFRVLTTDEISDPIPVLTAPDNELIGSEGNIVILLGKAKTKKTFLTILFVAGYIASSKKLRRGEILFFDTEQGVSHTQKIANRLKAMGDGYLDEEGFRLYALRELMPKDRAEFIENTCREFNPKLVIIDGIVDICTNFMDLEKSTETVQQLMTLSGELQCAIVGILHENKGKEDRNGRGHLGTIATQKAETVANLTTVANCDLVQVEFTYTRNKPPQPFTFSVDDDGLPYISSHGLPKLPKDYELWKNRLPEPLGHAELVRRVMSDTGKSERTAERHIQTALTSGVISKLGDKYSILDLDPL